MNINIGDILNLIAIIIAPIVAVLIGQWLQIKSEKRRDKLSVFKTLMISRKGWTLDSVQALNIIDIVFSDDKAVRTCWKEYYDKLCVENPTETDLSKIKKAQEKLLESIAISLGYKDTVTWETIQNPYIPKGMIEENQMQREYRTGQLALARWAANFENTMPQNQVSTSQNIDKSEAKV